ncbi:MAG: 2,3-bisphosphoglycerate-independent phosphoglycerate mutase, partial [Erysipelotrichaceae bacterium]|nr:2,3-bisphosphoglycerate-independent phosphoglycerate mutase [Erysipelotrichaceae bacterium]
KNENDPVKPKTSHTLNKVPFIIYNADVKIKDKEMGLANVANTIVDLLDLPTVSKWEDSIIEK